MAVNNIILTYFLIMFCSMDTFGQNVTEFSAVTNRIMDTSVHDDKKTVNSKKSSNCH